MTRSTRLRRALTIGAAFLIPLTGIAPVLPGAAHAQGAAPDLAAVARAVRAITTLKANFDQTDPNGQVQNGTVILKQPGHIRFDYRSGDLLVVGDGNSLNVIDYQVGQVTRLPIRSTPLGALLDPSRDLARYGKLIATGDPRLLSIEVRDPGHPEYGMLTLVFNRKANAPGGLELYGWLAKDAQGNRTTIRLNNLSYGAAIPNSAFSWRDPRPNIRGPRR